MLAAATNVYKGITNFEMKADGPVKSFTQTYHLGLISAPHTFATFILKAEVLLTW